MSILYPVATPIGNLGDISARAIETLKSVDFIAAEDTRVTRKLTSHFGIKTPVVSCHDHTSDAKRLEIVERLKAGKNGALVTDAGMPCVSDPGYELIRDAAAAGVEIIPIPGASAVIAAIAASGLPSDTFAFDGFPPRKSGELRAYLTSLKTERRTVCVYEAPGRLIKTLTAICEVLPDRQIAVCRELTKLHEETIRGTAAECVAAFEGREIKGEIAIVIAPGKEKEPEHADPTELLKDLIRNGMCEKEAVKTAAKELGLPKREVYSAALKLKQTKGEK